MPATLLSYLEPEIVEVGDAVGLCPEAGLAWSGKGCVYYHHDFDSIQEDGEPRPMKLDLQGAPCPFGYFVLHAVGLGGRSFGLQRNPLPQFDFVDDHIVLKRVGPSDVVVAGVLVAPTMPAA